MNRTQYFTLDGPFGIKVWRYKNNRMEYASIFKRGEWRPSCYSLAGHGLGEIKTKWIKISRDKARKLEPKAFKLNKQ